MDIIDRLGINGERFTVWRTRGPEGRYLFECTRDVNGTAVEPTVCIFTSPGIAVRVMREDNPNCRRPVTPQVAW